MKIVVIGGTGLIGSKVVSILRSRGHEVIVASPKSGVDAFTGKGLASALSGAHVVVDVSNAPSFEAQAVMGFFTTCGKNLVSAEVLAGVGHHVALSVVGTDRADNAYFKAKLAQEALIKASPIPYTIIQATQFFEFLGPIAQTSAGPDGTIRLSTGMMQPISSDDVAVAVADASEASPLNGTSEVAGPEPVRLSTIVQRYLEFTGDKRTVTADADAPYYGAAIDDTSLMPGPDARIGKIDFQSWLAQQTKSL